MPAYRASRCDLKTCTSFFAIIARRTRRMSSSLLPENITPQITSIQPDSGLVKNPSGLTAADLRRGSDDLPVDPSVRPGQACGRPPDEAGVPRDVGPREPPDASHRSPGRDGRRAGAQPSTCR